MDKINIVLATGGTGGHIFPALALKKRLEQQNFQVNIIADHRFLRFVKVQSNDTHIIKDAGLNKNFLHKLMAPFKILIATLQALIIMRKLKTQLVIGFGGYVMVPTILAAVILRKKIIIQEQNSVLGKANKFFAKFADLIVTFFPKLLNSEKHHHKLKHIGWLVRENILKFRTAKFDGSQKFNLLVLGGSQGAQIFSTAIPFAIAKLPPELVNKISINQQARIEDIDICRKNYQNINIEANIVSFFEDVGEQIFKADLIIARSGASTCSELTAIGRAAILVPYEHASNNHQFYNAKYLADAKAAIIIEQKDLIAEDLAKQIKLLMQNPNILKNYAENSKACYLDGIDNFVSIINNMLVDKV